MLIILLKFVPGRQPTAAAMAGHRAWLKRGFDDGVFLLAGTLNGDVGGGILAMGTSRDAITLRLQEDPFVVEQVVKPELIAIELGRADPRLAFLLEESAA